MMATMAFECAANQWLGERKEQNDSYRFQRRRSRSALVADGAGDDSREVADTVLDVYGAWADQGDFTPRALLALPQRAGAELRARNISCGATTLVGAFIDPDGFAWLINHGDSVYAHIRCGQLLGLSREHNRATELRELGDKTTAWDRAMLTRALGPSPIGSSAVEAMQLETGDFIMLATDGFLERVPLKEAIRLIFDATSADEALDNLISAATNQRGNGDNATCLIACVVADPLSDTPKGHA